MPPKKRKTNFLPKKAGTQIDRARFFDRISCATKQTNECEGIFGKIFGHHFIPIPLYPNHPFKKAKKGKIVCQRCGAVVR